jgi:hypothetical protein
MIESLQSEGGARMKNRILLVLVAVMLALSLGLVGCEQSSVDADAVVSECSGNLSVLKEDTASWVEAEIGMALESTDTIKCGDNSSAEISFLNGDTVEVAPGSEVEVADLIISTETDSAVIRLKLIVGSIIFRVVNIVDPASLYEVETPTGEVAIRGSAVQITVSEDGTTLVCNLEGDIWAIAQGVELQVPQGECCVIRPGEPPELVIAFPDPNLEAAIREAIGKPTGDIYPSDLEGLTSFDAQGRNITNLSGLEYCTGLTELHVLYNEIRDISPLTSLTSLTYLDLQGNQISDISPLANLTSLTWLSLWSNQISDISPLASLTRLTTLGLHQNQVTDISPLASLTSLTVLGLWSNQIASILPLASLTNLTILMLSANPISDISPLASLTGLGILTFRNSHVDDISPLANLTSLTWLGIDGNQISDISVLANLFSLKQLELHNNQISDISPLVDNEGLSAGDWVSLEGNPLSSDSINIYIPELEARGVDVDY